MDLTPQVGVSVVAPGREQGRITATIDTLVLRGFPAMAPARVEESFAGELSRLLREAALGQPAWKTRSGELPAVRLKLHTRPTARAVGRELARVIFEQIAGRKEAPP